MHTTNCLCNKTVINYIKTCLFLIYVRTIKSRMGDRERYIFTMSARLIAAKPTKYPIYLSQ